VVELRLVRCCVKRRNAVSGGELWRSGKASHTNVELQMSDGKVIEQGARDREAKLVEGDGDGENESNVVEQAAGL
jgi:hypothetical protein